MAKLRHLGIRTEDTGKLASFYVDVFDMKVIHKSKEEGGTIFLSDGYFNLAIIPNKDQNATMGLPLRLRGRKRRGHRREDEKDQSQQIAKTAPQRQALCGDPRVGSGWQLFRYLGAWFSRCATGGREKTS